tara:strand:+ start:6576 stop:7397 length:822 start_codon:yes stop_codon:yes gene_type:complete
MSRIIEEPIIGLVKGRNPNTFSHEVNGVSNSLITDKPIWNEDSTLTYTFRVNRSISIVSTSSHDIASGTGVKTIRITGIEYSSVGGQDFYTNKVVDVAMNGVTPVNVSGNWYRVTKLECIEFGSGLGLMNQGHIKVVIQGTAFVMNCMKAFDSVSNSLIVCPASDESIILKNVTINAYMQTFSELEFRIIRTDGSILKFQKVFINSNTPHTIFPIQKELLSGETFFITIRNLETIIGQNHISAMLESTKTLSGSIKILNKPYPTYGDAIDAPV